MNFDKSRVYTAANADELEPGSLVVVANTLAELKNRVEKGVIVKLDCIAEEDYESRFRDAMFFRWPLAYLVEPPKKIWIAYLAREGDKFYLTSCKEKKWNVAQASWGAKSKLFVGTEEEVDRWVEERESLTPLIKAWEDGKKIQSRHSGATTWRDSDEPMWFVDCEYREKPKEEKPKRMTFRQLAEWLARGNGQYRTYPVANMAWINMTYSFDEDENEVPKDYIIRRWDSDEWIEPTLDEYLKDYKGGEL